MSRRRVTTTSPVTQRTRFFPSTSTSTSLFPVKSIFVQNGGQKQNWMSTTNQNFPQRPEQSTKGATWDDAAVDDTVVNLRELCVGNFDAITSINDHVFIFKNQFVYRLDANLFPVRGYPIAISQQFPGLVELGRGGGDSGGGRRGIVDAAYQRQTDGAVVLFAGHRYWTFNATDFQLLSSSSSTSLDNNTDDGNQQRTIWDLGLPENVTRIDAVFVWPKNQRTYIFAGDSFWKYDDQGNRMDAGYPKSISRWHGIPFHIDGVLTLPTISTLFDVSGGQTVFFKSNSYWLFNDHWVRPEIGYPRLISSLFNLV